MLVNFFLAVCLERSRYFSIKLYSFLRHLLQRHSSPKGFQRQKPKARTPKVSIVKKSFLTGRNLEQDLADEEEPSC